MRGHSAPLTTAGPFCILVVESSKLGCFAFFCVCGPGVVMQLRGFLFVLHSLAMKARRPDLIKLFQDRLLPSREMTPSGENLVKLLDDDDGWQTFLPAIGPKAFISPFSKFHGEFWDWYWRLTRMRRDKESMARETLSFIAAWPRGGAKSTNVEFACIAEGAMGLEGYVLYVSLTQTSANSHVADIRNRLESPEIAKYFPDLAAPKIGRHGDNYGWRQDFLMTKGGWAIRPIGLDVAVRGFKEGELRPTLIIFDDIDDHRMSVAEVENNLSIIARSILPAGTPRTIHLVAQNLILEHGVVNQIVTGKTDVLNDHIPSVHPAFDPETLHIEKIIDEKTGKPTYEIITADPTWSYMDMDACRVNLNKTGLEAFMAEYQHDFTLDKSEKVIPEYDDLSHVITWSQFNAKFGTDNRIPKHWQAGVGLDLGYTAEHLSAWMWMTVAAEDSELPYTHFVYRSMTYTGTSIIDQVNQVMQELIYRDKDGLMWDERDQYLTSKMSHEKLGEQMLLNRDHDFNFSAAMFGKEDGIAQWRSLLRPDRTKPHPFHPDAKDEKTGLYELGRPSIFYIVDDMQAVVPKDDKGMKVHRAQVSEWRRKKVKLSNSGVSADQPMKYREDSCDALRMLLAEEHLTATPLTDLQRRRIALKEHVRNDELTLQTGRDDYSGVLMRRGMELAEIERAEKEQQELIARTVMNVLSAPPISPRFRH